MTPNPRADYNRWYEHTKCLAIYPVRIRIRGLQPADWETFFAWNRDDTEASRSLDFVWFPQSREAGRHWAHGRSIKRGENDQYFSSSKRWPV